MKKLLEIDFSKRNGRPCSGYSHGLINLFSVITLLLLLISQLAFAQDPVLPPANMGTGNMFDGVAGKPSFVYQNFTQVYQTRQINNISGNNSKSDLKVNSLLSMHQLIWLTTLQVAKGNLGFTVLMPIVKISATNLNGAAPPVNPAVIGDLIIGPAIQWSDKKLFGKKFSHRGEIDISFPTGSYQSKYAINPSAHLYGFGIYHAFTLMLNNTFSISARNQFNYNSTIIDSKARPGAFYNGNYSAEILIAKNIRAEIAGYYVTQLIQDSYNGDSHYYQNKYLLETTKQQVLGIGPGVAWFAPGGLLVEAKVFFETAVRNTTEGVRPALRLTVPLSK